jgi:metallo-beta-lactamase family protein
MPLLLKFHGALDEVLGSCSFVRFKPSGRTYAIDCGLAQRPDPFAEPATPANLPDDCRIDSLDGLFITHAHGDHVGALIQWLEAGFRGRIYCTAETSRLALIACEDQAANEFGDDSRRVSRVRELLKDALERFVPCVPGVMLQVEPGLTVECFPTSHILGSVAFRFSADSSEGKSATVMFSGDIGPVERSDETGSMTPARAQPPASDYVVSEATYGDSLPRSDGSRSCPRRLQKLTQVLERGLCEGAKSKIFFPAFSLQRSHDLFLDICHLLLFHRSKIGLRDGLIPRVYLDSNLARDYLREYLAFYEVGLLAGSSFINGSAALLQSAGGTSEQGLDLLRSLLGMETKSLPALIRSPGARGGLPIEVCWGPPPEGALGPYVVICGKGATNGARILHYLSRHLVDPDATFVLTGFVPSRSPGKDLQRIDSAKSQEERVKLKVRLPGDPRIGTEPLEIPALSVRSSFDDISAYYSGHADRLSVCRYVLADDGSTAPSLKGVFLVHGDRDARAGLGRTLREEARNHGVEELKVHLPLPGQGWFDCGADDWAQPVSVEIGLSLNVPISVPAQELGELIKSQFGICSWTIGPADEWLLEIEASSAASHTRIDLKEHNTEHLRLSAKTKYRDFRRLADLRPVFFRWREVINAIGLDKPDYFAGHKFIRSDVHYAEFERECIPHVEQCGQRIGGFIVAGKKAFSSETLCDLETLLTPHVKLFVFDSPYVSEKLNRLLFNNPANRLTPRSAYYIPVGVSKPAVALPSELDAASVAVLLRAIEADRELIEARSIAIPSDSVRMTLPTKPGQREDNDVPHPARSEVPQDDYEGMYPQQCVDFVVEKVSRRKGGGEALYVILRRVGTRATGILHRSNFGPKGFLDDEGAKIRAYVVTVDPPARSLQLSLIEPAGEAMSPASRAEAFGRRTGTISWAEMAQELGVSFDTLRGLVSDHFKKLADGPSDISASGVIPVGYELQIFDALTREIEAGMSRERSRPPVTEGFTFRKMGLQLGSEWNVDHILGAAAFFASRQHCRSVGLAVLESNPFKIEEALFPMEIREEFYALCHSASANGWKDVGEIHFSADEAAMPDHSAYALRELAEAWSVPLSELVGCAARAGIALTDDKFVGKADAFKLREALPV